jgi:hypothetical protein
VNPLPTLDAVALLFSNLLGKKVATKKGPPMAPTEVRGLAPYVDTGKLVHYAAATDAPFLAGVGAALAMIPAAVAVDAVRSPKLPENLVENAYEVLNIGASIFNEIEGTALHVKISKLMTPPLPEEVVGRLGKAPQRLDMLVCVPGYADSKLTLFALR